ncbi:hypothetical protein FDUTEX481_09298 [Tolypothrix sp. PCC 7601]|nr:hypothetical protein FDUTEX481_09298 [Tolypothrix sp. PCC 7601]
MWDGHLARPGRTRCPPHKKNYCTILALPRHYEMTNDKEQMTNDKINNNRSLEHKFLYN